MCGGSPISNAAVGGSGHIVLISSIGPKSDCFASASSAKRLENNQNASLWCNLLLLALFLFLQIRSHVKKSFPCGSTDPITRSNHDEKSGIIQARVWSETTDLEKTKL